MYLLIAMAAFAAAPQAGARPEAPRAIVPDGIRSHVPADLRSYYVGFLVNPAEPKDLTAELFVRHQAYIRQQVGKGVFKLVGPLQDDPKIRGMVVLIARDLAEARTIIEGDPAVQAGVFAVEVRAATFPNLDGMTIEYPLAKP